MSDDTEITSDASPSVLRRAAVASWLALAFCVPVVVGLLSLPVLGLSAAYSPPCLSGSRWCEAMGYVVLLGAGLQLAVALAGAVTLVVQTERGRSVAELAWVGGLVVLGSAVALVFSFLAVAPG